MVLIGTFKWASLRILHPPGQGDGSDGPDRLRICVRNFRCLTHIHWASMDLPMLGGCAFDEIGQPELN
jgi:hypothetical protein